LSGVVAKPKMSATHHDENGDRHMQPMQKRMDCFIIKINSLVSGITAYEGSHPSEKP
jgi:hypothetical protein